MEQLGSKEENMSVEKGNDMEGKSLSPEMYAQIQESVVRDVQIFFERNSSMLSGLSAELMGHAQKTKGTTGENFDTVYDAYKKEFIRQLMAGFERRLM